MIEKATPRKSALKNYKVEGWSGWFLVKARNIRECKREAKQEWGSGARRIKLAKQSDIDWWLVIKGEIEEVW